MKLYAHWTHTYYDRATHQQYVLPSGEWREVPEDIGRMFVEALPEKMCNVTNEGNPSNHRCATTDRLAEQARGYADRQIVPPETTQEMPARMSPQKRQLEKDAKKRSRRARMGV